MPGSAVPGIPAAGIRLVVGLGNPGREYDATRHNAGFSVLDRIASRLGTSFRKDSKSEALVARVPGEELVLMKPTTFMNLSGEAVSDYARFYRIDPASVLVMADDVALPLGALRLRKEGGSGGQKGLESVLIHFSTERVPRLRIGVGGALPGRDLSGHVLSRFLPEEQAAADAAFDKASDAALCVVSKGMDHAMNLYNAAPAPDKSSTNTANQP